MFSLFQSGHNIIDFRFVVVFFAQVVEGRHGEGASLEREPAFACLPHEANCCCLSNARTCPSISFPRLPPSSSHLHLPTFITHTTTFIIVTRQKKAHHGLSNEIVNRTLTFYDRLLSLTWSPTWLLPSTASHTTDFNIPGHLVTPHPFDSSHPSMGCAQG